MPFSPRIVHLAGSFLMPFLQIAPELQLQGVESTGVIKV